MGYWDRQRVDTTANLDSCLGRPPDTTSYPTHLHHSLPSLTLEWSTAINAANLDWSDQENGIIQSWFLAIERLCLCLHRRREAGDECLLSLPVVGVHHRCHQYNHIKNHHCSSFHPSESSFTFIQRWHNFRWHTTRGQSTTAINANHINTDQNYGNPRFRRAYHWDDPSTTRVRSKGVLSSFVCCGTFG